MNNIDRLLYFLGEEGSTIHPTELRLLDHLQLLIAYVGRMVCTGSVQEQIRVLGFIRGLSNAYRCHKIELVFKRELV